MYWCFACTHGCAGDRRDPRRVLDPWNWSGWLLAVDCAENQTQASCKGILCSPTPTYTLRLDSFSCVSEAAPNSLVSRPVIESHFKLTKWACCNRSLAFSCYRSSIFLLSPGYLKGWFVLKADNCVDFTLLRRWEHLSVFVWGLKCASSLVKKIAGVYLINPRPYLA